MRDSGSLSRATAMIQARCHRRARDAVPGKSAGAGRERSACYSFCGDSLFTECVERAPSKDQSGRYRMPNFQARAVVLSSGRAQGKDDITFRKYGHAESSPGAICPSPVRASPPPLRAAPAAGFCTCTLNNAQIF